jgi:branched-chain amino acid transport system permease protein
MRIGGYIFWLYKGVVEELLTVPGRVIGLLFFLLLLFIPLFITEPYVVRIFILSAIFCIFSASWDVLAGSTGQINLGHALFFGTSAYVVAMLNIHFGFPPWLSIPIGSLAAVIVGLFAGIPALRLRGFYLSLVTLSFPIILNGIIFLFPKLSGGEMGLYGIDGLSSSQTSNYYIVTLTMMCSILLMYKFTDVGSKIFRIGIVLHAIRQDEITARASGINTTSYKLLAFAVSGFFAGISGGLYTHFTQVAGPSNLEILFSFQPIIWTVFGGIGNIYGAVTGVYILYPILELARYNPIAEEIRFVILALILIFCLFFMPEGVTTWVRDRIEVKCLRCQAINTITRSVCKVCQAPLHLQKKEPNIEERG